MPLLNRCCCYDLRQGSLLIGIVSLIVIGLGELAVAIYCFAAPNEARKRLKFKNALFFEPESDTALYVFLGILTFVAILYIVVCSLLIHGVRKKKPFLLAPWIFFTFMNVIMAIVGAVLMMINSHELNVVFNIIVGIITLIIAFVWVYFTAVVFSFLQALQSGDYW